MTRRVSRRGLTCAPFERARHDSEEFAGQFGFSVNTLRHWEQGKRQPEGPMRAYLLVIERAPKAVQKALHAA